MIQTPEHTRTNTYKQNMVKISKGGQAMRKIILAAALTAALTLTAAPAFAAVPGVDTPTQPAATTGVASTNIKVVTVIDQINATLPLNVSLALSINGAAFAATNVPNNYNIVNNGVYPIKVSSAQAGTVASGWTLQPSITDPAAVPTSGTGDIAITLTPPSGKGTAWPVSATKKTDLDWKVAAAASKSTPTTYTITISGANSPIKKYIPAPTQVLPITYTIEGDSAA